MFHQFSGGNAPSGSFNTQVINGVVFMQLQPDEEHVLNSFFDEAERSRRSEADSDSPTQTALKQLHFARVSAEALIDLGTESFHKFKDLGLEEDMRLAIAYLQNAKLLYPPGENFERRVLGLLALCYQAGHMRLGDINDIRLAIGHFKECIGLIDRQDPGYLVTVPVLIICLRTQYTHLGDIKDIKEAIWYCRDALLLPLTRKHRSSFLGELAPCLQDLYELQGDSNIMEEAMQAHREALQLLPPDSGRSSRSSILINLANSLRIRYREQGRLEDLDEAIECYKNALSSCKPGDSEQSLAMHNLVTCYHSQYEHKEISQYLDQSIQTFRDILLLPPSWQLPRSAILNSLGMGLLNRFRQQRGSTRDLDEALQCYRASLLMHPIGHPDRAMSLINAAACLQTRYFTMHDIQDLEEGIKLCRGALHLRPVGHPYRPSTLNNLSISLTYHWEHKGDAQSLDEVACLLKEAIQLFPPAHPLSASACVRLASLFVSNPQFFKGRFKPEDITALFEKAANHSTASMHDRFNASLKWIEHGVSGIQAYEKCLQLADQYLLIHSSITSRHQLLLSIPHSIALDASALAIDAANLEKAVEFLEQGRTLLWSQLSRYRTSLEELWNTNQDLANEFEELSRQLEASATSHHARDVSLQSLGSEASRYRQVSTSWGATVDKIRMLDGFATFLLPPSYTILKDAAQNGPVIIINISTNHSDAIIIHNAGNPTLVPLPNAHPDVINGFYSEFTKAIYIGKAGSRKILAILRGLWDCVVEPVVTALQDLSICIGSRIWWCPTSWLTMLPLHAAGPYRRGIPNLPDIYVSSYTPTLSALIRSPRMNASKTAQSEKTNISHLLVVAQPAVPGQPPIPGVWEELRRIQEVIPSADVLLNEKGTCGAVISALQRHSCVHFMSHGSQDSQDPFNSCFHLHDKSLTLRDVIQARLPDAQYAFLSACHSAAGHKERPDETIHLAAALQFSGFRSVIGTMYAMADTDGPTVAEEVYKYMYRQKEEKGNPSELPRYSEAAVALNIATKVLRNRGVPIERWINFVHIGL